MFLKSFDAEWKGNGMKIFISVDMEGIGGVVSLSHVLSKGGDYQRFRKWMTEEILAVIEGAKNMGATKITIADSHGSMTNLLIEDLPEDVTVITGFPRPLCMVHGIWEGYDVALFLGYHARKGVKGGVMSHTISGRTFSAIRINGEDASEFYLNALVAGFYGVPVALVAGDLEICKEAEGKIRNIETVVTKVGITRFSARTKTLKAIKKELKEKTVRALSKVKKGVIRPIKPGEEILLELKFFDPDVPDLLEYIEKVERKDGVTIQYKARDIIEAYKLIELAMIPGQENF